MCRRHSGIGDPRTVLTLCPGDRTVTDDGTPDLPLKVQFFDPDCDPRLTESVHVGEQEGLITVRERVSVWVFLLV